MKKLMIAAAIVCAAVFAQAAQVDWSLAKDDAKTYGNMSVYVINGSDYGTVIGALTAGGDSISSTFEGYALSTSDGTKVTALNSRGAGGATTLDLSGNSVAFFIFTDGAIADGKHYDTTGVIDASSYVYTPPQSGTALEFDPSKFTTKDGVIGVPEPTSGLLLLLGVAGLALKRRRA